MHFVITKFSLFHFLKAVHPQITLTHATVLHISVKCYYYLTSLLPPTHPRNAVPYDLLTVSRSRVDRQCDKLVTDDRRQFITLTVHLS